MVPPCIHVGTSGWSYDHWTGVLYPPGTPAAKRRDLYAAHFSTVELNASFYRWPREATFALWRAATPTNFTFAIKAPRGLTHAKKLFAPERWLARMETALDHLGEKLGALLVQLPPDLAVDLPRLDYFLGQCPARWRVAVEFRHPSWHESEAVFALLEKHAAAYVVMSGANLPCVLRATAPFVYVRLHGPNTHHLYAGSYSDADLGWWAERIGEWSGQRAVFVYFNNDGAGNAVRNADTLRALLGA